jgi:hypothetical protein
MLIDLDVLLDAAYECDRIELSVSLVRLHEQLALFLMNVNEPHYHGSGVHREGHQAWHETEPLKAFHRRPWNGITWGAWEPVWEETD